MPNLKIFNKYFYAIHNYDNKFDLGNKRIMLDYPYIMHKDKREMFFCWKFEEFRIYHHSGGVHSLYGIMVPFLNKKEIKKSLKLYNKMAINATFF